MEVPEGIPADKTVTCSKCGLEGREARKFCSRCGFPTGSSFRQPVSNLQSLEPAIKTCAALFGINLLFLLLKITPESIHLPIEVGVEVLFCSVILFAVRPFRSKMFFLSRRFFNKPYPPWKMIALALLTAAGILLYFAAFQSLGMRMLNFLEEKDLGTAKVIWIFISAVLLAPVFEEVFFRGYLFQKFRLVLKPKDTIILQGLIFGIIHLSPAAYISHTMMGILFGYFRHRTQSLLPGMLCHAAWNFSVVGLEYWQLTVK